MKLPNLSIAKKLYLIFTLLATVTVALAAVAVSNARRHAALTDEFRSAFIGAMNVELVNGLIYAVVMESRGIYMSSDIPTAKVYGEGLLVFNERIGEVVREWQRSVRPEDQALFDAFSKRIHQFQEFRRELVRRGVEISPAAGREWGDNDANRSVRKALNADLTKLGELYSKRSEHVYNQIDSGISVTAWLIGIIAGFAVILAALGAVIISRAVARPLAKITALTQAVAAGDLDGAVVIASEAMRSARSRARSGCSRRRCARTRTSIGQCSPMPTRARAARRKCRARSVASAPRSKQRSPSSAAFPIRCLQPRAG